MDGSDRRAWIGSYTSQGGWGITTAALDPASGALRVLHTTDALPDPSYLALAPDAAVLYAVAERPVDGLVAAFSLRDPDAPRLLAPPEPVRAAAPTHLCLAGGRVHTANYGSGSVTSFDLGPDGAPLPGGRVLHHEGGGPDPDRQKGPHAHAVTPAPGGGWLLTVDLGTDSIRVCPVDKDDHGPLRVHHETALPPGTGPRHLAFHPDGRHAYLVGELASSLTVLGWDDARGTAEVLGSCRTLPTPAQGANYPSEVVVAPDARFLWVANRGADSITVLTLPDTPGALPEPAVTVPCGGSWPRDLVLDPVGGRLYAANERSGDVTWFDVDPATGVPSRAGSIAVPAATCVVLGP